jgi:23S rRNA (uracil1939-C5)-methyltransferase
MRSCEVLPRSVSDLLMPLRDLIGAMDQRDRLPQIELASGDTVCALVLRHLEPMSDADVRRLREFGECHDVQWWLQPKGPDSVHLLDDTACGAERTLVYELPEHGVRMPFKPTDFTQVNGAINRVLVSRALRLLDAQTHERCIDWFCGLGNFSLPLARRCAQVLGIEGSASLVQRAADNAALNGLAQNTRFVARDLFTLGADDLHALGAAECWLVDPPREGAFALAKALADLQAVPPAGWQSPRRIVYVSCNPATLARDAGLLVHQAGYRCTNAGVVNMFAHTAHVESLAVFDRDASA